MCCSYTALFFCVDTRVDGFFILRIKIPDQAVFSMLVSNVPDVPIKKYSYMKFFIIEKLFKRKFFQNIKL